MMRYFKTQQDKIRAIDEGQESLIDSEWTEIANYSDYFRSPFTASFEYDGDKVVVNFDKAKEQAHDMRRAKRDADMAPLDRQYTYDPEGAEPLRVAVREADAQLQEDIDACDCVESLTELMQ